MKQENITNKEEQISTCKADFKIRGKAIEDKLTRNTYSSTSLTNMIIGNFIRDFIKKSLTKFTMA